MIKSQHKTLARTLAFIGWHSPSEFGLFWSADGTMPWKEFYWVLQEDPELRFVRAATLKELMLLGIELPFSLEENQLKLNPGYTAPDYPVASEVPGRLYFGLRHKNLVRVQELGLRASSRPFLSLSSERDLALRIARRREDDPILIEILAQKASEAGILIRKSGERLYLAQSVPREYLLLPLVRQEVHEKHQAMPPKKKLASPPSPGSFTVQPHHVQPLGQGSEKPAKGRDAKKAKGGWKKDSRKERHKRSV